MPFFLDPAAKDPIPLERDGTFLCTTAYTDVPQIELLFPYGRIR
jgi:hypothetical protein